MTSYAACFVLGFLTDKIRLFPFILGILVGVLLKWVFDNSFLFEDNHEMATNMYETVVSLFTPPAPS